MFHKNISEMDFKELRGAVQTLYDKLEKMQRKYEDALNNIDSDNLSAGLVKEQGDMKAQITVTADAIKTMVSKTDLQKSLSEYSTIEQTADAIETAVSKSVDLKNAVEIGSLSEAVDTEKIYVIHTKDENGEVVAKEYYYYNTVSAEWEMLIGNDIYTTFEQTADGFKLKGNVLIDGNVATNMKLKGGSFSDADEKGVLSLSSADGAADLSYISMAINKGIKLFEICEDAGSATLKLFGKPICTASAEGVTFHDLTSVAVFG